MSVPCLRAARVGRKPELPNAVGNCSVGDFVGEVFVAITSCFGGGCEEDVLLLRRDLCANECVGNFVKGFLRRNRTVVFLEGTER